MAAELITPVDELTLTPLPLVPPEDESPLPLDRGDYANWHHHFHPSNAPQLLNSLGGKALRCSRIQLVEAAVHNIGENTYHAIYKGPVLPESSEEQFRLCVLACAGYVPRQAIDINRGNPRRVNLTDGQINLIRMQAVPREIRSPELRRYVDKQPHEISPRDAWRRLHVRNLRQAALSYHHLRYAYDPMRAFFTDYLLRPENLMVTPRERRRLSSDRLDEVAQMSMVDNILARSSRVAVDGLRTQYQRLHEAGYLHPHMTYQPEKLVLYKLGNFVQRAALVEAIEVQLGERAAA